MRTTHTTVATEADIVQVVDASQLIADIEDAEALFKEAKRRERRRRLVVLASILVILAGVTAIVIIVTSGKKTAPKSTSTITQPSPNRVKVAGAIVGPEQPYGLAVSPDGDLYVADVGRDQILRRLPSGKFQVVAGTGTRGFSGDGGLATRARISINWMSTVAVTKSGTVYFSDSGNGRVREVPPDGIIKTVVGGGHIALDQSTVPPIKTIPALQASLGDIEGDVGLTIGPHGDLYVISGGIYRLGPGGLLHWVVGENSGISLAAAQYDFFGAVHIAFDGKGDLLVAKGDNRLYEDTAGGKLRLIESFRGDGGPGSIAEAPDGDVLLAGGDNIPEWFHPDGSITPVVGFGSLVTQGNNPLDVALGTTPGQDHENFFILGNGAAVGPNGAVYLDTVDNNSFTSVSAILEVKPDGSVSALWRS